MFAKDYSKQIAISYESYNLRTDKCEQTAKNFAPHGKGISTFELRTFFDLAIAACGEYNVSMLGYLIGLFIIVPIAELAILIKVGQHIGALNTVSIVIATGVMGALLAKREGTKTLQGIHRDLELGILPGERLLDGFFIFCGGLMLLTPGLITDVLGFLLLIPYTRFYAKEWLKKKFRKMIQRGETTFFDSYRF